MSKITLKNLIECPKLLLRKVPIELVESTKIKQQKENKMNKSKELKIPKSLLEHIIKTSNGDVKEICETTMMMERIIEKLSDFNPKESECPWLSDLLKKESVNV